MHIHLARPAKNDAVLIDDVDLAVRLQGAQYLRGQSARVIDFVEGNPLIAIRSARRLIKLQGRFFPDVERIPVQHRLLRGLFDRDLGRRRPSGPRLHGIERSHRRARQLQSARFQAIGHDRQQSTRDRRMPKRRRGLGSRSRRLLHGPHVLHGPGRARQ